MAPASRAGKTASLDDTLTVITRLVKERWREYAGRYAIAFVFMALVAATTALSAWIMKDVVNRIFVERNQFALTWVPVAIIVIFVGKGAATYLQEVILSRIGNSIVADAQKRMYEHLLGMDFAFYQIHQSNDLTTRITLGAAAARDMLNVVALSLGRDLFTLIGLIVVMVSMNPLLAGIALLAGPIAAIGLRQMVRLVQKAARGEVTSQTTIVGVMRETSQGLRIVKSFQLERPLKAKMFAAIDNVEKMNNRIGRTRATVNPLIETLGGIAIAMVVAYAGWRTMSYAEAPGELFAFITALLLAADPARRLSKMQIALGTSAIGVRRMFEILDTPAREYLTDGKQVLSVTDGDIRFEHVTFGYEPGETVLDDFTLQVPAGGVTALVGPSGGGKSTVYNLLQRFWDPREGRIVIDGQPITDVTLASLRNNIALVSQDVFLFEGTIRENIAAGRTEPTAEQIEHAARLANAHDFIQAFPKGYDTMVGELGSMLSGGQRQRISIARAFLKDAPILLLDEPTSALDSESERAIQSALATLSKGRTALVIAHRLSTIVHADLIAVIEGGRIVETGTHHELLAKDKAYAKLHVGQSGSSIVS